MPPRALRRAVSVADLRLAAKKRLPRVVFDYIDGGADAEVTLRENCRAFEDVTFRPRSAVATPSCDLRTTVLGASLGLALGPVIVGSLRVISGLPLAAPGLTPSLAWGALGACAVAVAWGTYPIWRMNRMSAVAAVRSG